jgi:hypothetical protein
VHKREECCTCKSTEKIDSKCTHLANGFPGEELWDVMAEYDLDFKSVANALGLLDFRGQV